MQLSFYCFLMLLFFKFCFSVVAPVKLFISAQCFYSVGCWLCLLTCAGDLLVQNWTIIWFWFGPEFDVMFLTFVFHMHLYRLYLWAKYWCTFENQLSRHQLDLLASNLTVEIKLGFKGKIGQFYLMIFCFVSFNMNQNDYIFLNGSFHLSISNFTALGDQDCIQIKVCIFTDKCNFYH